MIDNLMRDLQLLQRTDSLIGKIWVNTLARRYGLFAVAALIAIFGLAMMNVAGLYALEAIWGPVWAAAAVAAADLILALVVMLAGLQIRPGPELAIALDLRKIAIGSLQDNAREIKQTVDTIAGDIQQTKNTIAGFVHNPLDAATEKLLIPAALSIIRSLRGKSEH